MSKTFDLGKKSDLKRLKNEIIKEAKKTISSNGIDIDCPKCKYHFVAKPGKNICPSCSSIINLDFEK